MEMDKGTLAFYYTFYRRENVELLCENERIRREAACLREFIDKLHRRQQGTWDDFYSSADGHFDSITKGGES